MKRSQTIALGLTLAAAAGILVFVLARRSKTKNMLIQIADEGYETAQDILFPGQEIPDKHLRYGPVLPR